MNNDSSSNPSHDPSRQNVDMRPLNNADRMIRDRLRAYQPPKVDKSHLRARLVKEIQTERGNKPIRQAKRWLLPAAAIILIAFGVYAYTSILNSDNSAIRSIEFISKDAENEPAFRWGEWRLRRGGAATTPEGVKTRIQLVDSSIVICEANTQIAIQYSDVRKVHLEQGEILVEVAKDKDHPFIVQTPLLNVEAVGTRFRVKIVMSE
ncbi:FecR family protein [bacterium]|nr:FecR family protein [bacterium]